MNTKTKIPVWDHAVLIALFCFAISLFDMGGYIFAFTAVIVLIFNVKNIKINLSLLVLILFSISYFSFNAYWHGINIEDAVKYLLGPWVAYIIGKLYVEQSHRDNALMVIILVLSAGMFLHGALNFFAYITSDAYYMYDYRRIAVDFWRGTLASVTVTGMFYTFATGISLGIIFSEARKRYKIISAAVLIAALMLSLFFANRTLIVIVAIISLIELTRITFSYKVSLVAKLAIIATLTLVTVFVVAIFAFDVGNINEWFSSLKIVQRYDDPVGRLSSWNSLFKDGTWIKYPFGNPKNTYRHNLWLDIYGEAGVIPFLCMVGLTLHYARRFWTFRADMLSQNKKSMYNAVKCLCLAFLLNCAVEPVIMANPYYFLIVVMFMGAIEGQIERDRINGYIT